MPIRHWLWPFPFFCWTFFDEASKMLLCRSKSNVGWYAVYQIFEGRKYQTQCEEIRLTLKLLVPFWAATARLPMCISTAPSPLRQKSCRYVTENKKTFYHLFKYTSATWTTLKVNQVRQWWWCNGNAFGLKSYPGNLRRYLAFKVVYE